MLGCAEAEIREPALGHSRSASRRPSGGSGGFLADPSNGLNGFFSNWKDPAIQKMVQKFTTTLSDSSRAKQWPQIQRALYEQTPVINVMNYPYVNAHSANTCGTAIDALGSDHLEDTWFAAKS
jgi:peptide/nickel transport system substrate-binding protein